ncbi:site-specific DNA-methyltransferase [Brevibacillus borstelensis]|uniref:site-specific DNA-methyltransferase n=1 Tax=Brevibacillus borstelensis TaxID=45462 RepID=UPI00113E6FB0|nr:site-specific DNA-methyltransferase [Brevibacillus borstelensis]MCM3470183.1 site-specific DNA-methyltransferase [Brevibacillus borstelensis]MCM3591249.1 site-specific DNA-methyltransferase [Brevibacillus borstelensis]TGV31068.1 site-specific DNA-methyltransferase [Mesorhizobium sp. M00.F.Ca.ET.186.01.1.1]
MTIEKLERPSRIDEERIKLLKDIFPEAFADGKMNFAVLREEIAGLDEDLLEENEEEAFGLRWVGKKEVRKLAFLPPDGTIKPVIGEGIDEFTTKNVFIEGDNLEVLRILKNSYRQRIKMIYIDPPYNTGGDLIYKDDYKESVEKYLMKSGQADEEGLLTSNPKTNGRFHANWLNMMYPRLKLAKELLKDDGLIFVSIDDNEYTNLKLLLDEIFNEENHIITLVWHRRQNADNRNINMASTDHEYILVYGRSEKAKLKGKEIDITKYKNPDNDPRGPWASIDLTGLADKNERPNLHYDIVDPVTGISYPPHPGRGWSKSRETIQRMIENNEILFPKDPSGRPRQKKFLKDIENTHTGFSSILEDVGFTTDGTREIRELFGEKVMSFPKPTSLLKELIRQGTSSKEDIIMDFFAGSATTAHAVLEVNAEDELNLSFILVQLPEPTKNAMFLNIAEVSKERIRRVIGRIKSNSTDKEFDNGFAVYKLDKSNIKKWKHYIGQSVEQLEANLELFTDSHFSEVSTDKDIVVELMLHQGFPLDSLVINKQVANNLWIVNHSDIPFKMLICLEKNIEESTVQYLLANYGSDMLICLDEALSNQAKILLSETMKVKTI